MTTAKHPKRTLALGPPYDDGTVPGALPEPDLDEIWRLADMIRWANENVTEPWGYATDATPTSAYAKYITMLDPDTVLALVELARVGKKVKA